MSSYLTPAQHAKLLEAINPGRVGKDGKGFSHVEAYEIRAHLNRIFGFGRWSADLTDLQCVFDTEGVGQKFRDGKPVGDPYPVWSVLYRATVRLTICAPNGTALCTYTEAATGEAKNQPHRGDAHDLAMKTAESQAMKRCAANLGDQFGLSLYRKGSTSGLVRLSLVAPEGRTVADPPKIDAHVTESVPESEQVEDKRETNEPAPPPAPPKDSPELTRWVKTLMAGPDKDESVAPFYARLHVEAAKGGFLNALVENRKQEMVSAGALLADEQKRTQRDRAA